MLSHRIILITIFLISSSFVSLNCLKEEEQNIIGPPATDFVGDSSKTPEINIIVLGNTVQGRANNINYLKTKVIVWAKTDRWYVQPSIANPYTNIASDGNWNCEINKSSNIVAILVNKDYPLNSPQDKHPATSQNVLAWDEKPIKCATFGVVGTLTKTPEITINFINGASIKGKANNIDVEKAKIIVWTYSDRWYLPKYTITPLSQICASTGEWEATAYSNVWSRLVVMLVSSSYTFTASQYTHPALTAGIIKWIEKPECSSVGIIGNLNQPPEVSIVNVTGPLVIGKANNINVEKAKVVVWSYTDRWYIQPSVDAPYTPICGNNGEWRMTTSSGGWNRLIAMIVDSTYSYDSPRNSYPALVPGVLTWTERPMMCPPIGIIGDQNKIPEVSIVSINGSNIFGKANNVNVKKTKVVVWTYTDQWRIQPTSDLPFIEICGVNGNWQTITSENNWSCLMVLLVDSTYTFSSSSTNYPKNALGVLAWTEKQIFCTTSGIIGDLSKTPTITIELSSQSSVSGFTNNIDVSKTRIVLWAATNTWYIQPWTFAPFTSICGNNGRWQNTTHHWHHFYALLVDSTYVAVNTSGTDPSTHQGVIAWDKLPK